MSTPFDVLIGVPIDSSGAFVGCERLPAALRAAGIVEATGACDLGNLQVAIADPVRDVRTGIIGLADVVAATAVIHRELERILDAGHRPLVLGGCCTLLLGVMAALDDAALLFVDGHLDCYDGASSPNGEAADMELAILLGVGPAALVGAGPRLTQDRVVVLGPADEEEAAANGAPDPRRFAPAMPIVTSDELRADPAGHARAALAHLDGPFWLHLDLDVLSARELPAVDYPQERGLTWDELLALLRPVLADERLLGADITILNPALDPGNRYGARAVRLLTDALST